jgi:hypothetical protein
MAPKEIAEEAIKRLNKRITNEVFLIIQNDRDGPSKTTNLT